MSACTAGAGYSSHHLLDNYDFASLGNGLVVDVGGAGGHNSFAIAQQYPKLNFLVQDLEAAFGEAGVKVPAELEGRVEFMAHNFLTPQPAKADLYYFRFIFHNWSDKYGVKIMRALLPALEPGARILVHDIWFAGGGDCAGVEGEVAEVRLYMLNCGHGVGVC